jgi:hypothetical protein
LVTSGDALEQITGAQERLAVTVEEMNKLLHSLVGQVNWQECYLDLVVTQGQYTVRETVEAAATGKMHLQHLWGTEAFKVRWNSWRAAFDKHIGQYTAASSIQREATGKDTTNKGEGMSKGKGKEQEIVVEEEMLDADSEEVESEGEDEDMEEIE